MSSVSVWDHLPTADELLNARVARGWRPAASELQGGARILGHAACLAGHSTNR